MELRTRLAPLLAALATAAGAAGLTVQAPRLADALRLAVTADRTLAPAIARASVWALAVAVGVLLALTALRRNRAGVGLSPAGRKLVALSGCGLAAAGCLWFVGLARAQAEWLAVVEEGQGVTAAEIGVIAAPARRLLRLGFAVAACGALPLALGSLRGCWTTALGRPQPGARVLLPLVNSLALAGMVVALVWACGHAATAERLARPQDAEGLRAKSAPSLVPTMPAEAPQERAPASVGPAGRAAEAQRVMRYGMLAALALFVAGATQALAASPLARKPVATTTSPLREPPPAAQPPAGRPEAVPDAP